MQTHVLYTQLMVKEALCIPMTPANNRINLDEGYELPGCWITTVKNLGDGAGARYISTSGLVHAWELLDLNQSKAIQLT